MLSSSYDPTYQMTNEQRSGCARVQRHIHVPLFGATSIGGFFPDFWSTGCSVRRPFQAESGLSARNHLAPGASAFVCRVLWAALGFLTFLSLDVGHPSRLRHHVALTLLGRRDGEGGRGNPPVEPELSTPPLSHPQCSPTGRYFLRTIFSLSSDATYCSVPLSRIIRFSPSASGCLLGRP